MTPGSPAAPRRTRPRCWRQTPASLPLTPRSRPWAGSDTPANITSSGSGGRSGCTRSRRSPSRWRSTTSPNTSSSCPRVTSLRPARPLAFAKLESVSGDDFLLFVLLASLATIGAGLLRDGQARAGLTSLERVRLALSEKGLPRGMVTRAGAAGIAAYFVSLALIDFGRGAWAGAAVDAPTARLFVAVVGAGDRVAAGIAALI